MDSKDLNRTQLIGMIARLRGALIDVIQNYKHQDLPTGSKEELKESIEYGEIIMDRTGFNLSKEDGKWFDNSWELKTRIKEFFKGLFENKTYEYISNKDKLILANQKYVELTDKYIEISMKDKCSYCGTLEVTHKDDCREGFLLEGLHALIDIEIYTKRWRRS